MNKQGKVGENIVCVFLSSNGYEIISRNFKTDIGEIDVIAADTGYLVFIEVKLRKNSEFGSPIEYINDLKIKKMNQVASQYINRFRLFDCNVRFDVIEVDLERGEVNHIKNAFESLLSL